MKASTKKHLKESQYDLYADLERIKEAFSDASEDLKGRASEIALQALWDAKEKSAAIKESTASYIQEKPLRTVGLALVMGAVIGYFLHK